MANQRSFADCQVAVVESRCFIMEFLLDLVVVEVLLTYPAKRRRSLDIASSPKLAYPVDDEVELPLGVRVGPPFLLSS